MKFFTADLHLNHKNIIKYCNRPFNSVHDMNDAIINNWNQKVTANDEVYILGDCSFSNSRYLLNSLNGIKHLVIGDHDSDVLNQASNCFRKIEPLMNLHFDYNGKDISITLCHWCMRVWRKSHFNSWHLYGHSHGKLSPIGKSWDIGVDCNNFTPLSLEDVIKIMENQPDNSNFIGKESR